MRALSDLIQHERCVDGGAIRSVTTPTREVGLLTAEGASDGRVEVVPPCCDLAVRDFEDTHDRHRYLDTVLNGVARRYVHASRHRGR